MSDTKDPDPEFGDYDDDAYTEGDEDEDEVDETKRGED
jgi:hypothetical protein